MTLALLAALGLAAFAAEPPRRARAVVLISVDTLRADALRSMPRLSAFAAREGVLFTQARSAATWTLPSHASMFASAPAARWRIDQEAGWPLPRAPVVLPELFASAGFRTAIFHQGPQFAFGLDRGFETARASTRPFSDALAWLGALPAGERYFLVVHTLEVHDYAWRASGACGGGRGSRAVLRANRASCRALRRAYDAAAACMDAPLAGFLGELARRPEWRATSLVVTSDHGESLCERAGPENVPSHGHAIEPFEEVVRVPLIWKRPVSASAVRADLAWGLDVGPTLLGEAGLKPPKTFEGRDLFAEGSSAPEALFLEGSQGTAVLAGRFKLVGGKLFDLEADPLETQDASGRLPAQARRLRGLRASFLERTPVSPLRVSVKGATNATRCRLVVESKPAPRYWRALTAEDGDIHQTTPSGFVAEFDLKHHEDSREFAVEPAGAEPQAGLECGGRAEPGLIHRREEKWAWPWPDHVTADQDVIDELRAAGYLPPK